MFCFFIGTKSETSLQNKFNNFKGNRVPPAVTSSEINCVAIILFLFDLPDGFTNLIISNIGSPITNILVFIFFLIVN